MVISRLALLAHAIRSCSYQEDLSWRSVVRYLDTFDYIMANEITIDTLYMASFRISHKNNGWRTNPAVINHKTLLHHSLIRYTLGRLIENQSTLAPEEIFMEFEMIHPYNDGNGRVGEILFYKLTGSFAIPQFKSIA